MIDTNFIILIDSFGNETKKEDGKNYIHTEKLEFPASELEFLNVETLSLSIERKQSYPV